MKIPIFISKNSENNLCFQQIKVTDCRSITFNNNSTYYQQESVNNHTLANGKDLKLSQEVKSKQQKRRDKLNELDNFKIPKHKNHFQHYTEDSHKKITFEETTYFRANHSEQASNSWKVSTSDKVKTLGKDIFLKDLIFHHFKEASENLSWPGTLIFGMCAGVVIGCLFELFLTIKILQWSIGGLTYLVGMSISCIESNKDISSENNEGTDIIINPAGYPDIKYAGKFNFNDNDNI